MSSRNNRGHHVPSSGASSSNPTYATLASLRDKLRSTKITERRSASKELLEKLQDSSTLRKLECEAERGFDNAMSRSGGGGGGSGRDNDAQATLPWERVCILYRSLMDAALLASRTVVEGGANSEGTLRGKKRSHANQTGFTKKSCKFNADDVLFPYKVFLRMDMDQSLECNDGGYSGDMNVGWEEDWKTRPKYGHHVDVASCIMSSSSSANNAQQNQHGRYSATHYTPHTFTDRNRGSRLSSKEIIACVDYCIHCLNDDDCCNFAETSLLQWLIHICSRPEYLAVLPYQHQLSHVLHELSIRLNRAFLDGNVEERGILPSVPRNRSSGSGYRQRAIPQQSLLAVSKCLSAMVYNCTTRLGMGMHLYIRPVIELVAVWAENAWQLQSEGEFASSSEVAQMQPPSQKNASSSTAARNPHHEMLEEGLINPSSIRRKLRTEADILSLLPYLYSSVTHLLAAHPEHSIPILSDHGHALLRLVRRNYARPTTNLQTRDALTEYVSAHLLVAETSGKVCGLPEGDVGPLVPRLENEDDDQDEEGEDGDDGGEGRKKKKSKKGATLDAKQISKLLEMIRNEKVWEGLFSPAMSGQDAKKKKSRKSLTGRKHGRSGGGGISLPEGGASWTPLTRRQRRHLELMARLVRISQRLYLAEAEDRGNGTVDSLESLIEHAEEMMQCSGIEHGEIDIQPKDGSSSAQQPNSASSGDMDERHVAATSALACSPMIRMVCRHLYKLNPKLGRLVSPSSSTMNASFTQDTMHFTQGNTQFTQAIQGSSSQHELGVGIDGEASCERILLESCPMLQALVVNESTLAVESSSALDATMTQGTLTASLTAPTPTKTHKNDDMLDSIRPTTTATLQFLCACAESFPRGECWASSTRQYWSTILDDGPYPTGTLANMLERHGSSPADAAAVVYLLGTTLESHGGSGGEDDIQLWTLVTLLKMTESSAIICSREGLSNAASFGSPSSLGALRVAWQYVWKLLFRYDLRYSSFTSGAFGNNVGELVLQLLTQIVRYQCVDRKSLFVCRPSSALGTSLEILDKAPSSTSASARSPFVHGEQGQLWKLPVFENASSILSCAPFELIANVVQYAGFSDTGQVAALATAASSMQMANSAKDRPWFVSFCLRFIESAMEDTTESRIRRTFLPFAATCLASLISDGGITSDVSTFELDGLTRFAITEDSEPLRIYYDPDNVEVGAKMGMNQLYTALWSESITPDEFLKGVDQGLSLRIVQGRGALLNKHLNAQYERYQLRNYMNRYRKSYSDAGISPQRNPLGGMVFEKVKSFLDELVFQLKYEDGNASDEDEKDSVTKDGDKRLALPQLTGCLSLILTVLLSKHSTANQISDNLVGIFKDTFGPTIDILVDNMASLKGCPSDFLAVFTHLHGIVRVLTFVAAFGGGEAAIPRIFGNQGKSLFIMCKSLLREHRNEACTLEASNQAAASMSGDLDSDSEDDHRAQTQRSQTQRFSRPSNFSDDSDGLMDDEDDENRDYRPKKQRAPPVKRRRIGNGSMSRAKKSSSQDSRSDNSIDSRGAWACASFMLVLQPSFKSVELISGHLVWPEDYNNQAGYGTVSKTPDPFGALVCATLFCQKSVILRRDRLDLQSERGEDEDEDQESALILSIETILQARRSFLPPSKHFMCGLGLVAGYIRIGDYSESCGPIGVDESKMVLEALYPEGVGKESDDYFLLRQWTKRILKYRTSYRSQQAHAGTLAFLYAQTNLIAEFGDSFGSYFMYASFRHIDENMRSLACDVLGAALIKFSDQTAMVTDVMKNAIPPTNRKKFKKWVNEIADQKLRDELTNLEDEALSDAEDSIKYHSIECIGMIAGSVSDAALGRDLIWKLIDLAAKQPPMLLPCYRACKRASFLLGFKSLGDMFDGMMPHFLVKWLESQRSLREFPLLLMSPFALERACQYLPNELLSMLSSGKGWTEDFFHLDEIEGESQTLNERVLTSFIESVAKFLIPNILLSASDDLPTNDGASKYLKEVVIILTGVDSDENVAKVLCNHIADLYGFVAVLAENGDATLECENAFKFLKRCVSSVHIERTGAKCAFLVLRHILLLHCKGISVVGLRNIELTSSSFIEGMKYVAKQLKAPSSNRKQATFLEQLGSSMTESIILVKYWLSSSLTARQRNESWGTLSLLYDILATENIQSGKIESGELGFCLHSFIAIVLDPKNNEICPQVLESLKVVLGALFSNTTKDTLVDGAIAVVHKLCLVLLQIHQRAYEKLYTTCVSALCCLEYEQKASQGLLSGIEDRQNSADSLGEAPWRESSKRDDILKHLIASKADIEERVSSDTMLMSYGCLEVIAKSGKMQLEDILGAEDIVLQCDLKEEVFRSVNEKYSMLTFFNSIQQQSTKTNETNLDMECEHFIRIMNEHPISSDEFDSATTYSSHAVLARLLALRRLQKALLAQDSIVDTNSKSHGDVYPLLLNICHSGEPEESRLISSRCLGELKLVHSSTQKQECTSPSENESLYDLLSKTIIAHLGQYLLSECADTSLVAMKTAKALLVTPAGKEVWQSLDGDIKGLLSPFNTVDDGKLRREAVRISDGCLERLKSISGSSDSGSWCWNDELWTCLESEESSSDLWIRNITCSIISCCFGKGSKVAGRGLDFRICQGLCAMEANFAATVFPALIFHLLDSEARDSCKENGGVQDVIMSNIAIGSPTSGKNKVISRCFSRLLSPKSNLQVIPPQAIAAVLNTLELIRAITEHRFLTSPEHVKNKSNIAQKQSSSDKKRRSCNASDTADINALESSPKWRGFPYGVVLRVSGLDVAKACFRVKRYYSALYYAEMSMQNLIGSGTFFEDFANDSPLKHGEGLVCDISGFGVLSQKEEISGGKTVLEQALVAKDIIGRCLSEIHAKDELQGVLSQGSALDLKQNITSLATLDGCRRDQTYSMLLDLDNGLQTIAKPGVASIDADSSPGFSTIASCLEDLGLNHVKRHYLAGVENRLMIKGQTDDRSKRYLREKWFEDSLNKTFQWDDTLLPQVNDGELPAVVHETLRNSTDITHGAPPSFTSQPVANFYESVHEALQSFAKNDVTAGLGNLGQARKSVLAELEFLAGSEAQSTGMVTHLIKLNTLGQLELVARTLDGKSSLAFLLNRWGFFDSAGGRTLQSLLLNDEVNFDVKEQGTNIDGALFSSIRTELFSVKEIALKVLANKFSSQEGIANALTSHIYKSCSIYRELGHPEAAKVSLSSLRSLIQKSEKTGHASGKLPLMLRLDDAKIMKSQDNLEGAIMTCRMIATHLNNATNYSGDIERDQICAESLLLGGLWMAENNVDSAETILSSFFEKAAGLAMRIHKKAPSSSSAHRASISSFKLGEFAANLHNSVDARISSEAWKRRLVVATERKRELEAVTAQVTKLQKKSRSNNEVATMDARIIHATLAREVDMDDREIESVQKSIQRYLYLAVESYCSALKLCPTTMTDGVSKHVFQLVSLWFKNCQRKETKDVVNELLKSNLSQIPTYRLVPLTYQLFSRIDEMQKDDSNGFQITLRDIVLKICSEHPYHGIVQILALSNGQRIGGGVNGRHANAYLENIGTTKVDAVNDIIQELRKQSSEYVSALIDSYRILMTAYMNLAEFDTTNVQKRTTKGLSFKQYKLDLDCCLSGGRRGKRDTTTTNMPAIFTKPPPIRPDAQYGNGTEDPIGTERVVSFEPNFDLTLTGLHRPKIVKCIGSRGNRFKQLVKGEDDLRQDAIMQQVFGTVNDLLRHEGSSGNDFIKKSLGSSIVTTRQLRVITYGITPLSPASGVLEWVDNTMCFGDFLTDKTKKVGAHSKYFPGEWGNTDVREFYRNAGEARNATPESKRKAFDKICENFSPAFRFFFLEYFNSSMEAWHTARTLYTRSCAVNSIVGHILGIGDRHTSNILVHTKTGEVVHIDFGIVFDQGKTLTTPELVPFRLTRDLVDGMGPSGTDGVFSKAAEATMGVMRNNADTLLTILSAVVSDPLYKWSLSPLKVNQHQRNNGEDESRAGMPSTWMSSTSDENRNDAADRAIAKIHEKLEGYEDGTSGEHKTVAGQVKLLINEARDPSNLCMMFSGWAPWM